MLYSDFTTIEQISLIKNTILPFILFTIKGKFTHQEKNEIQMKHKNKHIQTVLKKAIHPKSKQEKN